ncbi:hypothetical protein CGRA01v4_09720 [Colletotrichum graminicola]|nr:hypothetical protein CGRA01v4_09720 [Colletotrichum graminicola]
MIALTCDLHPSKVLQRTRDTDRACLTGPSPPHASPEKDRDSATRTHRQLSPETRREGGERKNRADKTSNSPTRGRPYLDKEVNEKWE